MPVLGVDDFKAKLVGGGARPNLFKVEMGWPNVVSGGNSGELAGFLIKAASLPASNIASIPVPFRGRQLQVAGDRTFEPWTITVINDLNFQLRNTFEVWMNAINSHKSNTGSVNTADYMSDCSIYQLDRNGDVSKGYKFIGCWPSAVSEIEMSYESTDVIEEFTVELQVQYWESETTT